MNQGAKYVVFNQDEAIKAIVDAWSTTGILPPEGPDRLPWLTDVMGSLKRQFSGNKDMQPHLKASKDVDRLLSRVARVATMVPTTTTSEIEDEGTTLDRLNIELLLLIK